MIKDNLLDFGGAAPIEGKFRIYPLVNVSRGASAR